MAFIKHLNELDRTDLALAGGKGANLGALLHAGLPVPGGFAVTTQGYGAFVTANALDESITRVLQSTHFEDPPSLEAASSQIRAAFEAGQIPPELAVEITRAYQQLSAAGGPSLAVAVRSSATAEDLPDLSFAGQQDTYLNIVGEPALLDAVRRCWASLWTGRAIAYRARNAIPQEAVALAVVVQQMVESEASGVLFTANPLTGKRSETVIDATLGLGEALVSGQVEPDHYVVEDERILSKTLGAKALAIRGQAGGGTVCQAADAAQVQALPDGQIVALARLGQQAAAHFGGPQDMEWAFAGGRLYVVQSRPITSLYPALALPPAVARRPGEDDLLIGLSFGAVQGMLDPMTPLSREVFAALAARIGRFLGLPVGRDTQRALLTAGERLWLNLTTVARNPVGRRGIEYALGAIEPGSMEALQAILREAPLQGGKFHRRIFWRMRGLLAPLLFNVIRNLANPAAGRARLQTAIARFLAATEAHLAAADTLQKRIDLLEETFGFMPIFLGDRLLPAVVAGQAPLQFLFRLTADLPESYTTVLELTRGLPYNVTTEMDLALWRTAQAIKADPLAVEHFASTEAAQLAQEYLQGALPPGAQAAVAAFMGVYGMRGVAEIDLGRPRWREDPTALLQALGSYLRIDDEASSPQAKFEGGKNAAAAAEERLVALLRATPHGAFKARLARWLIRRVRELTGLRETPKFTAIRAMGLQRQALLAEGQELVRAGMLGQPEDVFFLHLDELRQIAAREKGEREVRELVSERRAAYAREMRRKRVPRLLLSDGRAFYEGMGAAVPGDGQAIVGSPVSPGTAEGVVHVVLDPRGTQLAPGEILVCPGTDPAWTPLFLAAGGLVMEVGGMMTHGSVVAREYGIPAVVGVHQATTRLKTGQKIRIDGSAGRIEILS